MSDPWNLNSAFTNWPALRYRIYRNGEYWGFDACRGDAVVGWNLAVSWEAAVREVLRRLK
jgi:hypothetical protein